LEFFPDAKNRMFKGFFHYQCPDFLSKCTQFTIWMPILFTLLQFFHLPEKNG